MTHKFENDNQKINFKDTRKDPKQTTKRSLILKMTEHMLSGLKMKLISWQVYFLANPSRSQSNNRDQNRYPFQTFLFVSNRRMQEKNLNFLIPFSV